MDSLIIEASGYKPKIVLDPINNIYEISGQSIPENPIETYEPLFKWIKENLNNVNNNIDFKISLEYFNTASAKLIFDIILKLEEYSTDNRKIKIVWCYDKEDIDMQMAGEDYAEASDLTFEFVELDSE